MSDRGLAHPLPRVWAVLCYRAGENSQILALAEALEFPYEIKRLSYRPGGRIFDVWRGSNRLGIRPGRSSPLQPPWPDLIISAGMRNEPVCRWIRKRSGGRTRYVHIGKPWGRLEDFDLVVTVPEYPLPDAPNLHRNRLSLHRITPARLRAAAREWEPQFGHLPRPWIALLAGGYSGPYPFTPEQAATLARSVSERARSRGGALLVTTSARTSARAARALREALTAPHHFHDWRGQGPNPYLGYLALADEIVVTCDSATMLAEACATGRPVYMFDLEWRNPRLPLVRAPRWYDPDILRAWLYRRIMWPMAPARITRDIRVVHRFLRESGRAVWLGEEFRVPPAPPLDEMAATVRRIRELLGVTPRMCASRTSAA